MRAGFTVSEKRSILGLALALGARMLGFSLILPVFATYAMTLPGATRILAGIAFGVYGLSQALLQIPFGYWSDRYGRRTVVSLGLILFIIGCVVSATASHILMLMLGFFLQGCGAVASSMFAWVADATDASRRNLAMAALGISIGGSIVFGLSVSNTLALSLGVPGLFWLCGGLSLFAILIVLAIPDPPKDANHTVVSFSWAPLHDAELRALNASGFIINFTMRAVFFAVPLMLQNVYRVERSDMWKIYLPMGLIGGFFMMAGSRLSDKGRARSMIMTALLMMAGSYVLLGFVPGYTPTVLGYGLYFAGFSVLEALLPAAVSKLAEASARGLTIGVYNTLQFLGTFAGSLAAGGLSDHVLYAILLALTVAALVMSQQLKRVDQIGIRKAEPIAV